MPTRIAEIPLIDMNFVDFSMSSLMSCNVSSASLFSCFKSSLRCKVKMDFY